ncbi:MAG: right-handed parallel beta-helix repeat-containing protein [Deltaproteobacteria bacterium]|nr:right-handed parallel beta-helix repeat-containing protein [Deltaproteobacteria bacterium]
MSCIIGGNAWSADRYVTQIADSDAEGTLRTIIRKACDRAGNDIIHFHDQLRGSEIMLNAPLVIPQDCIGSVDVQGPSDREISINGSGLAGPGAGQQAGDFCTLYVYPNGNFVQGLSFSANDLGAGVCLFGRGNTVSGNRFETNRYGVVVSDIYQSKYSNMDGGGNIIRENTISESANSGIWVRANENQIIQNSVVSNGRHGLRLDGDNAVIKDNVFSENSIHGIWLISVDSAIAHNTIEKNDGYGIVIAQGSSDIMIGGASFTADGNTIRKNISGGVLVSDDENNIRHAITHNRISNNDGLGIDLGNDGVTENDAHDEDSGPNSFLNFMDYLQAFPLVPSPEGVTRYWAWGLAYTGNKVEIYGVAPHDASRFLNGGGDLFLADSFLEAATFKAVVTDDQIDDYDYLTLLSFDEEGNTSEYSVNIPMGPDADFDGIPAFLENGISDESSTDAEADSDHDFLSDGVEDRNRNGVLDDGETAAFREDTDGDGLTDGVEVHQDGVYNIGIDTNPLLADTDGDGLSDGAEDTNRNGIWEAYLRETSPLWRDSDRDNFNDASDTCPAIPNSGQEARYCRI